MGKALKIGTDGLPTEIAAAESTALVVAVSGPNKLLGRTTSGAGGHEEVDADALAENTTPEAGDWLVSYSAAGDLQKIDVGNLPGGGAPSPQIDEYNTAGAFTWDKPAGAKLVHVICIGGGGGGGAGYVRQDTTVATTRGGCGGSSGARSEKTFNAAELSEEVNGSVGVGGNGGASATTINGAGGNGQGGSESTFGGYLLANGGTGGANAGTATSTTNTAAVGLTSAGAVTSASLSTNGQNSGRPTYASFAGGSGGGMSNANPPTTGTGGNGRSTQFPTCISNASVGNSFGGGGGSGAGSAGQLFGPYMSVGGGGGGASLTIPQNGGAGGPYGAGGGGGGNYIATVASPSSSGGAGGPGAVIIITYF